MALISECGTTEEPQLMRFKDDKSVVANSACSITLFNTAGTSSEMVGR